MYVFLTRVNYGYASFILVSAASVAVAYWAIYLRRLTRTEEAKYRPRQAVEQKNWVYDLIKGNDELIFVAEVPGPEEAVNVRLVNGILYIRGGQNFARDVQLEVTEDMGIAEFKYRNGVLTLRIRRL